MSPDLSAKFDAYENLLKKWSKTINLVAPSTLSEIRRRHIIDSLQVGRYIPENASTLLDIGSGAGFPGLVLAMANSQISVSMIESDERKCSFLRTVSRETSTPVIIHNARVENVNISPPDVITARALSSLNSLLEMTRCWWVENQAMTLIFPKGGNWEKEVNEAQNNFQFAIESHTSETDTSARILVLRDIHDIK